LKIQTPRTFPTPEMKLTYAYLIHRRMAIERCQ
jgi:hypothetical protein